MKPNWQNAPQWANRLADMLTHEEFIRKQYPDWEWFEETPSSSIGPEGGLIAMDLADLYYLMDKWAEYKISGHVEDPSTKPSLNVGGGGFLDPE